MLNQETASAQPNLSNFSKSSSGLFVPGSLIRGVDTDEKVVALTFDDGPSSANTTPLMGTFEDFGLAGMATFFMAGNTLKTHRSLAREVRDRGYEIGSHSMTHSYVPKNNCKRSALVEKVV